MVAGVEDDLEMGFIYFLFDDFETFYLNDGEIGFLTPFIELDFLFEEVVLHCQYIFFETFHVEGLDVFRRGLGMVGAG